MTLPAFTALPLNHDQILSGDVEQLDEYLSELVQRLEQNYEQTADNVNGTIDQFDPVLKDTATSSTYTYTNRSGWYLREGIMVDYWFDVTWSAIASGTPSGNLYIELPYKVFDSTLKPFVGPLQTSTLAYGAGLSTLHINAIPGTFRGEIWGSGSAATTANVTANTAAGQLIGHIRYVGVEFE